MNKRKLVYLIGVSVLVFSTLSFSLVHFSKDRIGAIEESVPLVDLENEEETTENRPARFTFLENRIQGQPNEVLQIQLESDTPTREVTVQLPLYATIDEGLLQEGTVSSGETEGQWIVKQETEMTIFEIPISFDKVGEHTVVVVSEDETTSEVTVVVEKEQVEASFVEEKDSIDIGKEEGRNEELEDLLENNGNIIDSSDILSNIDLYTPVYNWDQLVQSIADSSITKIILMQDINAIGTSNFTTRTEELEINGNGFTLNLNSNSILLGNLNSGQEKVFHLNNIIVLVSSTSIDFIRANDSVAGGRWRILIENTTISGSRRAVDARRSEVILKESVYIRTRRSNFALGSFIAEENARYTSIIFNSNRAAVWFPRNVSGAAVTGTNSEFRVKTGARVNFYRENNVNGTQPAVFRHFRTYVIEENAQVNYFYQNQNGGVAPLGDQSAANGRPQEYSIQSNGALNIYTANQMGIHFRRRDTSLITETGAKLNVLLVNQNNSIVPEVPTSPTEGEDGEDDEEDDEEDEPDSSLDNLINLSGTRTSVAITNPRSVDIRSNTATNLFSISSTSSFTIENSHISIWSNFEEFWQSPVINKPDVYLYKQEGQTITSTEILLNSTNMTNSNYKRIKTIGTTIYDDEQAEIKVSYVDVNGSSVLASENINGSIGIPTLIYSATPGGSIEEANYIVKDIVAENGEYDDSSYEFTPVEKNSDLTFILENVSQIGTVLVEYIDQNGTELTQSEVLQGNIGEEYFAEEKYFDGWELIEKPSNAIGSFTEEDIRVTYSYQEITINTIVPPLDPLDPEIEVDPENPPTFPGNQGLVSIDFVSQFNFGTKDISIQDQIYFANPQRLLNEDGTVNEEERPNYIQVSDRRSINERGGWELSLTQEEQFKTVSGKDLTGGQLQLANAELISVQQSMKPDFVRENTILVPGSRHRLIMADGDEGQGTRIYRFGDRITGGESVILSVPNGANPDAENYTTKLKWELSILPGN